MNIFEVLRKCFNLLVLLFLRIFNFNNYIKKKFIIFGLPSSGKTSILYFLKLGYLITTVPTYLINEESFTVEINKELCPSESNRFKLNFFEIGNDCSANLIKEYADVSDGLIYVVDSTKRRSLSEAREDFIRTLYDFRFIERSCKFLIFINKQDSIGCLSAEEIINYFSLPEELLYRCKFISCSTMSGNGIKEGLEWLLNTNILLQSYETKYENKEKTSFLNDYESKKVAKELHLRFI